MVVPTATTSKSVHLSAFFCLTVTFRDYLFPVDTILVETDNSVASPKSTFRKAVPTS